MNWVRNKLFKSYYRAPMEHIKKHFFYVIFLFLVILPSYSATIHEGNTFLKNGQMNEAIVTYESIVKEGYIGHELFFNLGTAYAKIGRIDKAILNFEKALRISPMDKATTQQLMLLKLKLQDKPSIYEDTGLLAALKRLQFALSTDAWAILSIVCMMLLATSIFVSYRFQKIKARKVIFLSSILWLLLSGLSVLMARNNYHYKYLQVEGVVNKESIKVFDQADPNSTILYNLHLGTKVSVDDSTANLYHINYAEKQGWILNRDIQKIEL